MAVEALLLHAEPSPAARPTTSQHLSTSLPALSTRPLYSDRSRRSHSPCIRATPATTRRRPATSRRPSSIASRTPCVSCTSSIRGPRPTSTSASSSSSRRPPSPAPWRVSTPTTATTSPARPPPLPAPAAAPSASRLPCAASPDALPPHLGLGPLPFGRRLQRPPGVPGVVPCPRSPSRQGVCHDARLFFCRRQGADDPPKGVCPRDAHALVPCSRVCRRGGGQFGCCAFRHLAQRCEDAALCVDHDLPPC